MISIDKGVFFVKNNKIALELYDLNHKFIKLVYDGKNTIILINEKKEEYTLENIVPEVRSLLKDGETLLVMHNNDNVVKDVYFLKIKLDDKLAFEDNFSEKSKVLVEDLKEFIEQSAV